MSRIMKINEKPPRLYSGEWINIIRGRLAAKEMA